MARSPIEAAAVSWREARMKACAAPVDGFVKDKKGDMVPVPNLKVWTDLGAAETALSKAVSAFLEQEAKLARWLARPKLFVVHGMKWHSPYEELACTLKEAIEVAAGARENNSWCPMGVRTVKGEVVLTEEQIDEKIREFWT